MLVFMSHLVVILPYLVEVERIEELDRAVESCHDQADILDVCQLGDWFLNCLGTAHSRLLFLLITPLSSCFASLLLDVFIACRESIVAIGADILKVFL